MTAIIRFDEVTKEFGLGQLQTFRHAAVQLAQRMRGVKIPKPQPFCALREVDLAIEAGEVVGIIGQNGAGKSTLLKLLANISQPTRGRITVQGRIAPLIEVGAGLVQDLTGRENIYVNGVILGMRKREIDRRLDEIVSFAELEQFIDTPIKRYSSGMQIRLGFSIATCVESEILIVDEVLAVGDLAFQRKCFDRMEDLIKRQGRTVLIVSHNVRQIERLCDRAILLERGQVVKDGEPTDVCAAFYDRSNEKIKSEAVRLGQRALTVTDDLVFQKVELFDDQDRPADRVAFLKPCRIRLKFEARHRLRGIAFMIGIHTTDFVYVTSNNTMDRPIDIPPGTKTIDLRLDAMRLLPGAYSFRIWIGTPEGRASYDAENLCTFQVTSSGGVRGRQQFGVVHLDGSFDLHADEPAKAPLDPRIAALDARADAQSQFHR
ncbi:MAG TPA: ABC transporter ATP-binding protein [Thermoanaerobaculia bacterium]|nr:ABC transporter ATP-binding protein [Thermoanaerobaculia bacterium]